jgi:hypothetical protein
LVRGNKRKRRGGRRERGRRERGEERREERRERRSKNNTRKSDGSDHLILCIRGKHFGNCSAANFHLKTSGVRS